MKEIEFKMSLEEANLILEGLGKLAFERVFDLIGKLQEQAKTQLQTEENGDNNRMRKENETFVKPA